MGLAGALAEIARDTLKHEFRSIDPAVSRILLLEGAERILPSCPPKLAAKARAHLEDLGVTVRTGTTVTDLQPDAVVIRVGDRTEAIPSRTVLWGAGVKASPLGGVLAAAAGIETDRVARIPVEPDLTLPGHPEVFVIGDLANFSHQKSGPLPGVAQVAMQQGRYAAELIRRRLRGKSLPPFRYRDYGSMATVGRARAVARIGPFRLSGYLAWLTWLFVHLLYLVEFQNRILVLLQWAWDYFTWNRSARLITGENPLPIVASKAAAGEKRGPRVTSATPGPP